MRMYDIIAKKRDGKDLSPEEINFFVNGYTSGEIPDYQAAALTMAIYWRGMSERETAELTMAMANSGDIMDLSPINGVKVDKHSTGGVGDKTSLVLGPMVAALGVPVAKMSGRGLGHTGGTIDKLESFPGFVTGISEREFYDNVNRIGIAIAGQTGNLAPADKKLYALRDVTATVESIPLIAASIMSKKIAAGADVIVLDVKTGGGAFMKDEKQAISLAREMVRIGTNVGRKTTAVISNMDEPLGCAIGNSLEVIEAINTLDGRGPKDLLELCLELGSHMVLGAGAAENAEEARAKLLRTVEDKSALRKLAELVDAQRGDARAVYDTGLLPSASIVRAVAADKEGFVESIACERVGLCAMVLGGGRETKESVIDLSVGIVLNKKTGDHVKAGEALAFFYANDEKRLEDALGRFEGAYRIGQSPVQAQRLIKHIITEDELR
ncbi:MAG: pyrimidine-nucleoside phosphorylase [Butyrivibrio sp.]|nr:pyrimidine-nucleoside phosphorylase [Butyrivibrio sp.]